MEAHLKYKEHSMVKVFFFFNFLYTNKSGRSIKQKQTEKETWHLKLNEGQTRLTTV